MKRIRTSRSRNPGRASAVAALLFALSFGPPAGVPTGGASQKLDASEILARAVDRGGQAREALKKYTYYAELTLETVSPADTITGKYYRFSKVSYDDKGNEKERVFETTSTLPNNLSVASNSVNNLLRVYSFMVTPETMRQYEFNYIGRENIDELNTYVFDVKPKVKMPNPEKSSERYLKGRVWIDDQDFLVVKVGGEALPEQSDHRTPKFETYFQNHDKYWFPAYTKADDEVRTGRRLTRVIITVRFTTYERAAG
ncbi:MAG TPA: outer membrane lipoprotein-sorting protein [Blastocatellia bacterium]|nr:outer membrane lipoprotein-sorting protein [Blastocatellia bacterium]